MNNFEQEEDPYESVRSENERAEREREELNKENKE